MSEASLSASRIGPAVKVAGRLLVLVVLAAAVGSVLNGVAAHMQADSTPAGFWKGMIQGALMPMSFPNLVLGRDVTIYAQTNTGVSYKLGYTAGVNICGAIFFGLLFWRVRRWRRWALSSKE